jgi:hypothetical protein
VSARIGVAVMAVLLVLYFVLAGQRAVVLLGSGVGIGIAMGVALLVLPLVGAWAIGRELMFGFRTQQLVGILDAEGGLPVDDLPKLASGRPVRAAADEQFPRYQADVAAAPESWRAWFRLGLAYDASGDRRRARHAIRTAISLHRGEVAR